MTKKLGFVLYFVLSLGYFFLRLPALEGAPTTFIDTADYTYLAGTPFWSREFLCGSRPFILPLLYKLLGNNHNGVIQFQWCFAGLCWITLAMIIARAISVRWLKPIAFVTVLLFSLSTNIVIWDRDLLTESISISLLALFISCWFWLLMQWRWMKTVVLIFIALVLSFIRDANAYSLMMVAGLLVTLVLLKYADKRFLLLATAFTVIFAANQVSLNHGKRWVFPFFDVMGQRILTSQQRTEYFSAHGMPVSEALMQRAGKWAYSDDEAFFKSEELIEFRAWVDAKGKSTYTTFLLAHPGYLVVFPLREWKEIFSGDLPYASPPFRPPLPTWLNAMIYPLKPFVFLPVAFAFMGFILKIRTMQKEWMVPFAMLFIAIPSAMLTWHADAQEIARHSISAAIQFRLAVWLIFLFLFDVLVSKRCANKSEHTRNSIAVDRTSSKWC